MFQFILELEEQKKLKYSSWGMWTQALRICIKLLPYSIIKPFYLSLNTMLVYKSDWQLGSNFKLKLKLWHLCSKDILLGS